MNLIYVHKIPITARYIVLFQEQREYLPISKQC